MLRSLLTVLSFPWLYYCGRIRLAINTQEALSYLMSYLFAPMIYTAPYLMCLMSAEPLRGQVGGGLALEIKTFWAL